MSLHVGRYAVAGAGIAMLLVGGATRDGLAQAPAPVASPSPTARPAAPPSPPILSPEVHPDRTVTFRLRAPNAKEVVVAFAGSAKRPMQRDDQGVWSLTTEALDPDDYSYSFEVDGLSMVDPGNPAKVPNLLSNSSLLHVPGPGL